MSMARLLSAFFFVVFVLDGAAPAAAQSGDPAVPPGYEGQPPADAPPQPADPYAAPGSQQPAYPTQGASPQQGYSQQPAYPTQPAYPAQAQPAERELRSFSLTISPFHLVLPIVELMGDFRIIDKLSLAAILGIGTIGFDADGDPFTGDEDHATVFELGAQVKFYAIGHFDHALQLGLEILFIYLDATFESRGVTGTGSGLAIGPFIGYKYVAPFGLTVDIQAGAQLAGVAATATDGATTEEDSTVEFIPLVNLNFGWSF